MLPSRRGEQVSLPDQEGTERDFHWASFTLAFYSPRLIFGSMRNDTVIKLLEALRREAEEQHLRRDLSSHEYVQILEHAAAVEELFAE